MSNQKKDIVGIKETKNRRFFGYISLLLDEIRLKTIKVALNNSALEYFRYNIAMNIRDDDKKLEAIDLLGIEDYEKIEILNTLKSDDKKLEVLKWFDDEWMRLEVAREIKDDSKKIIALDSFENEEIIGELARNIRALEGFEDSIGLGELIKTTKSKNDGKDLLKNIEEQVEQVEKIKNIKDDNEKVEAIKNIDSEYLKAEAAKTIKDDNKKIEVINSINNEWCKAIIAEKIEDEDKKIAIVKSFNENEPIVKVAYSIKDANDKIKLANSLEKEYLKTTIVGMIKDDDKKIEFISSLITNDLKSDLAKKIENDDKKIKALELLSDDGSKFGVILTIKDVEKRISYFIEKCNHEYIERFYSKYEGYEEHEIKDNPKFKELVSLLKNIEKTKKTKNDDKKIEFIDSINNEKLKIEIIETIKDDDKKIEALEKLSPEQWKKYRNISGDIDFIKNNIEKFIEKEGFKGNIPEGIIDELYEKNNSVVLNIDFRLLDEKHIELLGKDKINLISCYPIIQEQILSLEDNKCYIFSKCIDCYMENMETEEWTILGQELLDNISSGEYDELLQSIPNLEKLSQEDFRNLTQILQNSNWCDITDINQVKDFEEIRREKCNEIMQDKNAIIEQKKEAVIQKIFGHDYKFAKGIVRKFGEDIENINDGDSKDYVECLKLIEKIENPDILEEIFNECEFIQTDKVMVERTLKNEYGKLFNEGLYRPKEEDLIDKDLNIYEAGTDFKIIMTSIGAYYANDAKNYKDDWNRPAISTQHVCTSYIRNDMIGTAPIKSICYGFSEMKEDSLMLSGNEDMWSSKDTFNSTVFRQEKYYTPEGQINNTKLHNEMDFRRIQGGEKKQPNYILVFRENGRIPNMEEALKASRQWGGMPIVVVDKDKCLEAEREKVNQMLQEYEKNPNQELKKQIKQKIRNNRVTNEKFCDDIDENLSKIEENDYEEEKEAKTDNSKEETKLKVTEEELRDNYGQISATERKKEVSRIRDVYKKIKDITRGDEHGK